MSIEIEVFPDKAQYRPGEDIRIIVNTNGTQDAAKACKIHWTVYEHWYPVQSGQMDWTQQGIIHLKGLTKEKKAYGIFVEVLDDKGNTWQAETAFDIADHWREAPRYGFLSDFSPQEAHDGESEDIAFLNRHHINLVQFYDWMYRHDELVPADGKTEFIDPMGRPLSLKVVLDKIKSLREKGIASIAYAAIYAGLKDYVEKHPEQMLYAADGQPYSLIDLFFIMDISENSDWCRHILPELRKTVAFGFDGMHLDQYGFPKKAIHHADGRKEVVALKDLYPAFIDAVRGDLENHRLDASLIFNNVSTYPVHTTAQSKQDAIYLEVWDPVTRLGDLKHIIDRARELSGKQVILAAYLPPFNPKNGVPAREAEIGARITLSTIFANGGYQILLGEDRKVLTTAYYPDYGPISDRFAPVLTRYYDYIVMYRDLLFDLALDDISMTFTGGINTEIVFAQENVVFSPTQQLDTVWTILKEKAGLTVIHMINLRGLDNDVWHEGKKQDPTTVTDIEIHAEVLENVSGVHWASPDHLSIRAEPLAYDWTNKKDQNGKYIRFKVPQLSYWTTVFIQTEPGIPAEL